MALLLPFLPPIGGSCARWVTFAPNSSHQVHCMCAFMKKVDVKVPAAVIERSDSTTHTLAVVRRACREEVWNMESPSVHRTQHSQTAPRSSLNLAAYGTYVEFGITFEPS